MNPTFNISYILYAAYDMLNIFCFCHKDEINHKQVS